MGEGTPCGLRPVFQGPLATVVISAASLLYYLTLFNQRRPKENEISKSHGFDELLTDLIHGNKYILKQKVHPHITQILVAPCGPHTVPGKTPEASKLGWKHVSRKFSLKWGRRNPPGWHQTTYSYLAARQCMEVMGRRRAPPGGSLSWHSYSM